MPKAEERRLRRRAHKLGLGEERTNAYVYGTLRKMGWKPLRERKRGHSVRGAVKS
jgi:hypothetical protein